MKHAANAFSVSNLEDICEMPRLLVRVKSLKVLSMLFVNIRGVLAQLTSQPEPMALLFVLISSLRNDVVNALNKQMTFLAGRRPHTIYRKTQNPFITDSVYD